MCLMRRGWRRRGGGGLRTGFDVVRVRLEGLHVRWSFEVGRVVHVAEIPRKWFGDI